MIGVEVGKCKEAGETLFLLHPAYARCSPTSYFIHFIVYVNKEDDILLRVQRWSVPCQIMQFVITLDTRVRLVYANGWQLSFQHHFQRLQGDFTSPAAIPPIPLKVDVHMMVRQTNGVAENKTSSAPCPKTHKSTHKPIKYHNQDILK